MACTPGGRIDRRPEERGAAHEADDVVRIELRAEADREMRAAGRGRVVIGAGPVTLVQIETAAHADERAHRRVPLKMALELGGERHHLVELAAEMPDDVMR